MKKVEPIQTVSEIQALKEILSSGEKGKRDVLIFCLGINTAYRLSELRLLKLKDVLDISEKEVKVKEQLTTKDQRVGTHHTIQISNKLQQQIMDYVKMMFKEELLDVDMNTYLFPSQKGHNVPLSRQSIWRIIHSAAEKSGIKHIGSHSLRKTFGYFLYKQGTPIEIIQELLNHSSRKETLNYIGISDIEEDDVIKCLDL